VGAVLLAAGGGSRFSGATHKLHASVGANRSLLAQAAATAVAAGIGPVAVVVGAVAPCADLEPEVSVITNTRWSEGQATSLQAALAWAADMGHGEIVVGLGDQPGLTATAWRSVAAAHATPIAVATYDGRRGHPIRLAAAVWPDLPTEGDTGARALLRARPALVTEVPCDGDPTDIDTVADLDTWLSRRPNAPGAPTPP